MILLTQLLRKRNSSSFHKKAEQAHPSNLGQNPLPTTPHVTYPDSPLDGYVAFATSIEYELPVQEHKKQIAIMKKQVLVEAKNGRREGNYNFDLDKLSPIEDNILNICRQTKREILSPIEYRIREYTITKERMLQNLAELSKKERKKAQSIRLSDQKRQELERANDKLKKIPGKKIRIKQLRIKFDDAEAAISEMLEEKFGNDSPRPKWFNNPDFYRGSLVGLFGTDSIAVFYSIRESQYISEELVLPITFTISVCTAISANGVGDSLEKKDRRELLLWGGIAVVLIVTIFLLRIQVDGGLFLPVLNLIFCAIGVVLSFKRSKTDAYFELVSEKDKMEGEIGQLEDEIKQIKKSHPEIIKGINKKFKKLASKRAKDEILKYKRMLDDCDNAVQRFNNYKNNIIEDIDGVYDFAINICRKIVQKARYRKGLSPIFPEASPDGESGAGKKGSENKKPSTGKFSANGIHPLQILLLVFSLLFPACSSPPISQEYLILVDVTQKLSEAPYVPENMDKLPGLIMRDLGIKQKDLIQDGLKVRFSVINNKSMPPYYEALLRKWPKGGRIYPERRKELGEFWKEFNIGIEWLPGLTEEGLPHTFANYSLFQNLVPLVQGNAEVKKVIIIGDVIQHNPEANVSFYKYRDDPDRIMVDKEDIASRLNEDCPLPRLDGVSIMVIHSPEIDDLLFQNVRKFWTWYLTGKGAEISFISNI